MDKAAAEELIRQLRDVGHANTEFGGYRARLDVLLVESLAQEMSALTAAINESARTSSAQTGALITWTRRYVIATILILLVTGAGVVVSALNTLSIIGPMD
jgi:hypothetical protein